MKNKIFISILFVLCINNTSGQQSALEVFQEASKNILSKKNIYYKFTIKSTEENGIFPLDGELYLSGNKHFINSQKIDQINDGVDVFTIIHENKEVIVSTSENMNFFVNFTPNQILNYFMQGFKLEIEENTSDYYIITARDNEEEDIVYNITLDSSDLSINTVELIKNNKIIYSFLTLTYEYNLKISPSLFKFEKKDYNQYLIVSQN